MKEKTILDCTPQIKLCLPFYPTEAEFVSFVVSLSRPKITGSEIDLQREKIINNQTVWDDGLNNPVVVQSNQV